jgi:hypothetical protein
MRFARAKRLQRVTGEESEELESIAEGIAQLVMIGLTGFTRAAQIFLYALPSRWYMSSIVKTEFKGTTFAGAHPVPVAAPGSPAFACDPGIPSCYGYTGEQVPLGEEGKTRMEAGDWVRQSYCSSC